MRKYITVSFLFFGLIISGILQCSRQGQESNSNPNSNYGSNSKDNKILYRDVSEENLPVESLKGLSMDAKFGDIDGDGDLDIVIANEFKPNILLINDGSGHFSNESEERIPQKERDSEDVGIADFNGDGHNDIIVVTEDDTENELYLNRGDGTFTDASDRLPVEGTSNAVLAADINKDGLPDIIIGNNGQNEILINRGDAQFNVGTEERLPQLEDVTQDIELGDADGDGDMDLIVGNEGRNRLLINDGTGHFNDESDERLSYRETSEETREADFGDINGDGHLDLLFANVKAFVDGADMQNRVLINNGNGRFVDETKKRLPEAEHRSFDGDLFDLDGDGDLDLIFSNTMLRSKSATPFTVYENDGDGIFTDKTSELLPVSARGFGFDAEFADLNGDGKKDLYLANRGSSDILLLRK